MKQIFNLFLCCLLVLSYSQTMSAQDAPQARSSSPKFVALPKKLPAARQVLFKHADKLKVRVSYWEKDYKIVSSYSIGVIPGKQRGGEPDLLINTEEAADILKRVNKDGFFARSDLISCTIPPDEPHVKITLGLWDDNTVFVEARVPSRETAQYLIKFSKLLPERTAAGIENVVTAMNAKESVNTR